MHKVRLFIGTYIDSDLSDKFYTPLKNEFKNACFGKWVEKENLHFTYHFIGDINSDQAIELKDQLKNYLIEYSSEIVLKGLGFFPTISNPNVMHIKIYNRDNILSNIFNTTRDIISNSGIRTEKRKFTPHLTLVRIKDFNPDGLLNLANKYKDFNFGMMENFSVNLIESRLTPNGPIYKIF